MYMGDGKSMKEGNQLYWIWLSQRFGIASKDFPTFAERFGDPYEVYRLTDEEIEQIDGLSARIKEKLCDKELDGAYSILKHCKKNKIQIIGYGEMEYPERLKNIENPPVLLYCMGRLPDMDTKLCIGMVGTRKMSEYGKQTAYKISYELAASGVCIVSGMALGIDGVCAVGAIEGGGVTVAVLGSGLMSVYPKEHAKLMRAIARNGAVISEYPPFERPFAHNFPMRNRLISGLCQGVTVIEGSRDSGAMITASRAISQGRELFAVPGNVSEVGSEGPNELIRNGANVVLTSDDLISHYDFLYHDVINYRAYSVAKRRSALSPSVLKAYGIYYADGREEKKTERVEKTETAAPVTEQTDIRQKAEPKTASLDVERMLSSVDKGTAEVYARLPDGSFTPDMIVADDLSISTVMTSLTVLEISGLVVSLPGGAYKKA